MKSEISFEKSEVSLEMILIRNPIEHYNNSTPLTINVQNNS